MDNRELTNIELTALRPFANHPFKLYGEERLNELAASIRANGVMIPIVVRPLSGGLFEILSGHNRVKAAELAGLETIPAVIREDLADDNDALIVVTETNLIQRSFADMSYSEKAAVLAIRHDAMVHQGKRTDLINDVRNMLKPGEGAGLVTSCHGDTKLETKVQLAQEFGLSPSSIARYVKINDLVAPLKKRLDDEEIGFKAALSIAYLDETAQHVVNRAIEGSGYKITPENAEKLRERSTDTILSPDVVEGILKGDATPAKPDREKRNFGAISSVVSKHFTGGEKTKDIKRMIDVALTYYLKNKDAIDAERKPQTNEAK